MLISTLQCKEPSSLPDTGVQQPGIELCGSDIQWPDNDHEYDCALVMILTIITWILSLAIEGGI